MARHTYITQKIITEIGNLFSEEVLETLDQIDTGFKYNINFINSHHEFVKTYRRRITKFKNSEDIITTSTITDNYIIYKANSLEVVQGIVDETYRSNPNSHRYTVDYTNYNGNGIIVFITEKVSKELDKIIAIERTINIAII